MLILYSKKEKLAKLKAGQFSVLSKTWYNSWDS